MTTANTYSKTPPPETGRFRLPDIPERAPDEKMTSYDHLHRFGMANSIAVHVGNPETTLVEADRWIVAAPGRNSQKPWSPCTTPGSERTTTPGATSPGKTPSVA